MASIKLQGATSGEITVTVPNVAGTNTLTLPASTGTIVTDTGAQTIQFSAGSAAAPSVTTTGDTNTGMFFPAADTIAFAEGGAEAMRIDSSGNVGIGTSPSTTLHVKSPTTTSSGIFAATIEQAKTNNGTATTGLRVKYTSLSPGDSNHIFRCEDSGGTYRFYVQNNGTYGGTSDRTLKENIVDATDKLADLRKIKVRNYNWIEHGPEGGLKELGFIAQEVEEVFPKLVKENPETGKKMLLDSVFVPILVKALQEAADKIEDLETRIQALENA